MAATDPESDFITGGGYIKFDPEKPDEMILLIAGTGVEGPEFKLPYKPRLVEALSKFAISKEKGSGESVSSLSHEALRLAAKELMQDIDLSYKDPRKVILDLAFGLDISNVDLEAWQKVQVAEDDFFEQISLMTGGYNRSPITRRSRQDVINIIISFLKGSGTESGRRKAEALAVKYPVINLYLGYLEAEKEK